MRDVLRWRRFLGSEKLVSGVFLSLCYVSGFRLSVCQARVFRVGFGEFHILGGVSEVGF